ncbi:MAG: Na/Pi symporter [Gammaproteobacteria bacterium]|nr:Na/Pi symporter [Gammaproteobacteria bacterium]MDH5591221.1 Na/Pi symporter [Gammaproteobacteria bacterium]
MAFFSTISAVIGGLGLFLLGMWLMSDGIKMTAGSELHHFLHRWTKTRLRGLTTGLILTALIQSSSAITITTIGFANAGLLSLKRAIWIVFGSNLGTTTTAWIVILIGFNLKISTIALPMITVGMFLKLLKPDTKFDGIGQAFVGFGILFLGITTLKDAFVLMGTDVSLTGSGETNINQLLLYTGIGFLLTVLMQSSSVTLAITLTALSGGVITLLPAAAIVIGGNLGTTTTAVLSSIGTNSIAKRVVASHVIFNLITAVISLILLSPLLSLILFSQDLLSMNGEHTISLALFHTLFNLLGVLLMWPITNQLINWLSNRFKTEEENESKLKYLNKQSLSLPSLALHALSHEIQRVGQYTLAIAKDSINYESINNKLTNKESVVKNLTLAIGDYTSELYRQILTEEISEKLPIILRISQYYDDISELAVMLNVSKKQISTELNPAIQSQLNEFYKHSIHLLDHTQIGHDMNNGENLTKELSELESEYQSLKSLLLRRGAEGTLSIAKMDKTMASISHIRRINQQAVKASMHFSSLNLNFNNENNEGITSV